MDLRPLEPFLDAVAAYRVVRDRIRREHGSFDAAVMQGIQLSGPRPTMVERAREWAGQLQALHETLERGEHEVAEARASALVHVSSVRAVVDWLRRAGTASSDLGPWTTLVDSEADALEIIDLQRAREHVALLARAAAEPSGPGMGEVRTWAAQDVSAWDAVKAHCTRESAKLASLSPNDLDRANEMSHARQQRLARLATQPFGFRVDAEIDEPAQFRGTKRRFYISLHEEPVTALAGDPAVHVISFTSPHARLRHTAFDEVEEINVPRGTMEYLVALKAQYRPNLAAAVYRFDRGEVEVADPRAVVSGDERSDVSGDGREEDHRFGLQQIVFKTDVQQDAAMRLPITGHALVTGSPGSGKTTIAIQRVVYAIREHRRELGLAEDTPAVFTEQNTTVFVRSRVLKPYVAALLTQLEVPYVHVEAFDAWRQERLRGLGLLGHTRDESNSNQFLADRVTDSLPLGWLKTRQEVLGAFSRHATRMWIDRLNAAEGRMVDVVRAVMIGDRQAVVERLVTAFVADARRDLQAQRGLAAVADLADAVRRWLVEGRRRGGERDGIDFSEDQARSLRTVLDRLVTESATLAPIYRAFPESPEWSEYVEKRLATEGAPEELRAATGEFTAHLRRGLIRRTDESLLCWLSQWATRHVDARNDRTGRGYRPFPSFAHVVIDEVQDFTEVESEILVGLADTQWKCVTAAGDLAQSLDPLSLTSWGRCGLQVSGSGSVEFRVNYRQTLQLGVLCKAFCTAVLNLPANYEPNAKNLGPPPNLMRLPNLEAEASFLVDAITKVRADDPRATVVVISGTEDHRRRLLDLVKGPLSEAWVEIRVSSTSDLAETEPVHITSPDATKGLEFDAVFLMGVDQPYDVPGSRLYQHFYVAISRPRRTLVVSWRDHVPEAFRKVQEHFAVVP